MGRSRTRLLVIAGVIVVAVVAAVLAVWLFRGTADPAGAGASTGTPAPTDAASTSPSGSAESTEAEPEASVAPLPPPTPPEGAQEQPIAAEQDPVAPTETATGADGASVALVSTEAIEITGQLPGEISGPGVKVTVQITNTTDAPMNMDYVAVNLYTGDDRVPALPIPSADSGGFGGELAVGEAATASYVFLVDEQARSEVLVGVDYLPGAATVTFSGPIGG